MNGGRGLSKPAATSTSLEMTFGVSPANGAVGTAKNSSPNAMLQALLRGVKALVGKIVILVQRANDMLFMTNLESLAHYASASYRICTMFLKHFDNCSSFIATLSVVIKVACCDIRLPCRLRSKYGRANVHNPDMSALCSLM
jgi:hypothetical protein